MPTLYNDPNASTTSINDNFLSSHASDALSVYAVARSRQYLNPDSRTESEKLVLGTLDSCPKITLEDAVAGIHLLKDMGSGKDTVGDFAKKATQKWPEATVLTREGER